MERERTVPPTTDETRDDGVSPVDRRSYLRFAGAAVAAAGGVASVGAASATRRVDVTEAGADESGRTPVNDALRRAHGDGVELYFPPGEYRLDPLSLEGDDWSLVGEDATLVVPGGADGDCLSLGGSNWTVEGFTVDPSGDGAAPTVELRGDDWTFRDVEFAGRAATAVDELPLVSATVESADAAGRVAGVSTADHGASAAPPGPDLLRVTSDSEGTLRCRGCAFVGPAANGLDAADAAGSVVAEDCLFADAGVRLGGGAVVRNCAWRATAGAPEDASAGGLTVHGGPDADGETRVEACEFEVRGADAPAVDARGRLDRFAVRDTRIEQRGGRPALRLAADGSTAVERTSVTGDGDAPAVSVSGRGEAVFRRVCLRHSGDGVRVAGAADCRVVDSTVDVGGDAFAPDADVTARNVSFDGACPAPRLSNRDTTDSNYTTSMMQQATLPKTIAIEGTGSPATYEFTVGGELERVSPTSHPDAWDGVSGTTATGWVSTPSRTDTFRFSGSVTDFAFLEGDATVYVDGEEVDPSSLVAETSLPRTVTVTGTSAPAAYEFSVDGELEADPERGDPEQWGNVSGATASGWVASERHVDSYQFSGDLTAFEVREGTLSVAVDGEEVDPPRL